MTRTRDLQATIDSMRMFLDRAIELGEEPIAELWSQAIEYVEMARRLVVKAGGMTRLYKLVATERANNDLTGAPMFECVIDQCKAGHKAAGLERSDWWHVHRQTGDTWLMTPFGVIEIIASDTCPRGHIEWLA